jgi:hypothetical protein
MCQNKAEINALDQAKLAERFSAASVDQPILRGGQYFIVRYVDNIMHEWGPFTAEAALHTVAMRGSSYSLVCRHGRETPVT